MPFDFEGGDLFNLGSADVDGNTVVTGAAGMRVGLDDRLNFGVVYEEPLSDRSDLMKNRITPDFIWTF